LARNASAATGRSRGLDSVGDPFDLSEQQLLALEVFCILSRPNSAAGSQVVSSWQFAFSSPQREIEARELNARILSPGEVGSRMNPRAL
jgi:hypothetical protein